MGQLLVNCETDLQQAGVYGIELDNKIVYVGSTYCLEKRWRAHSEQLRKKAYQAKFMYVYLNAYPRDAHFVVLAGAKDLDQFSPYFTNRFMLDTIELGFIRYFKPRFNTKGIDTQFSFDSSKADCAMPTFGETFDTEKISLITEF